MKIQLIGCGAMGKIILDALLDFGVANKDIFVQETDTEKVEYLQKNYAVHLGIENDVDVLILAVKPQDFLDLDFAQYTNTSAVCSVMAGISVAKIQEQTGVKNIIRTMPNLALSVGRGVTGVLEVGTISVEISEVINGTLSKVGKVVKLKNEEQIDHIAALSGSGPAYFYKLAEILKAHAIKDGFSEDDARIIADETLIGAALTLDASPSSLSQLKEAISSKGGTTEAALKGMEESGLDDIVEKGIKASVKRAQELNIK